MTGELSPVTAMAVMEIDRQSVHRWLHWCLRHQRLPLARWVVAPVQPRVAVRWLALEVQLQSAPQVGELLL